MIGFDPVAWLSFLLVGFGLLIHITLVNIVLGMSVIVPFTEYLSHRRKDSEMLLLAKRLFRYLAISDLIAGVFGTWVAVDLTAFFPKLLYIFSTVLFLPVLLSIVGIVITIPATAVYWYGWDRISPSKHLGVGAVMGIGALLVPGGFRVLFAFVDDPSGFNISSLTGNAATIGTNFPSMFTNPIYVALLFHSWFGALTMSALFAAGVFGWHLMRRAKKIEGERARADGDSSDSRVVRIEEFSKNEMEARRDSKFVRYLLKIGLIFLVIQSMIGVVYYFALARYSPYVFAAITGNTSVASYNFELVFVPFIALVIVIWITTMILYLQTHGRKYANVQVPAVSRMASFFLAFSAFAALPLGEASNDASRAPYMMLTGTSGIPANSFANNEVPISWPIAYLALTVAIIAITVFVLTIYFVFVRRKVETGEETVPQRDVS